MFHSLGSGGPAEIELGRPPAQACADTSNVGRVSNARTQRRTFLLRRILFQSHVSKATTAKDLIEKTGCLAKTIKASRFEAGDVRCMAIFAQRQGQQLSSPRVAVPNFSA